MSWSKINIDSYSKLMYDVCKEFVEIGYHIFLDAGTLLGAVRENKFIPYDHDIDLFYLSKENNIKDVLKEFNNKIKPKLLEKGFGVRKIANTTNGRIREMLGQFYIEGNPDVYYNGLVPNTWLDLWIGWFDKDGDFNKVIAFRKDKDFTIADFIPAKRMKLEDYSFPVPANYEKYLEKRYGKDWRIPKKTGNNWNNYYERKKVVIVDIGKRSNKYQGIINSIDFHELQYMQLDEILEKVGYLDIDIIYMPNIENGKVNKLIEKARNKKIAVVLVGELKNKLIHFSTNNVYLIK